MKTFILFFGLVFTFSALAQIEVREAVIDLGEVHETLGSGTRKVTLKLDGSTPKEFKVKFTYKYRFTSTEIATAYVGANGQLGIITRPGPSEQFVGKETLRFDVEKSSLEDGRELSVLIEISKPNKNTHGVKVKASLVNAADDVISGHKRLLGLLGRSYTIERASCSQQ